MDLQLTNYCEVQYDGVELTGIWSFLPLQIMWCNSPGLLHFCQQNWPENGHFYGEELNQGCSLLKPRYVGFIFQMYWVSFTDFFMGVLGYLDKQVPLWMCHVILTDVLGYLCDCNGLLGVFSYKRVCPVTFHLIFYLRPSNRKNINLFFEVQSLKQFLSDDW